MSLGNPPTLKPSWPGSPNHQLITPTRWSSPRKYLPPNPQLLARSGNNISWNKDTFRLSVFSVDWRTLPSDRLTERPWRRDEWRAGLIRARYWSSHRLYWNVDFRPEILKQRDKGRGTQALISQTVCIHQSCVCQTVAGLVETNRGVLTVSGPQGQSVICPAN